MLPAVHAPPLLRRPFVQVVVAVCSFGLPFLLLPSAMTGNRSDVWVQTGLAGRAVRKISVADGSAPLQYVLADNQGVYRSTDGGVSWQAVNSGLPSDSWGRVGARLLAVDPTDGSVVYVGRVLGGDSLLTAGLFFSDDAGATWLVSGQEMVGKDVQAMATWAPDAAFPSPSGAAWSAGGSQTYSVVLVATSAGVFRSVDRGTTWSRMDWRGVDTKIRSLTVHPEDPAIIYLGTEDSGLYWSRDRGSSWKAANGDVGDRAVNAVGIAAGDWGSIYVATDVGLYRSSDDGRSWAKAEGPLANQMVNDIAPHPLDDQFVCVGVRAGGAFCSSDGGRTWVSLLRGLGKLSVLSLTWDAQDSSILWAGTTDGVWRYVFDPSDAPVTPPVADQAATTRFRATASETLTPSPASTATRLPIATETASPTALGALVPAPPTSSSPVATPTTAAASTATEVPAPTTTLTPPPISPPEEPPPPTAPPAPPTTLAPSATPTIPLR